MSRIKIAHLYPIEMNIYGDTGNVLVLEKRLKWRGIEAQIERVGIGDSIPNDVDIIVSGGGQDRGASSVEDDLRRKGQQLKAMSDDGVAMLLICGTYQLFGHRFITNSKEEIKGIGILDVETYGQTERLIGNISISTDFGDLVGYENHSGLTYLGDGVRPLGKVISGAGNNGQDSTEGACVNNVFGTYLHGPVLPKNPLFADEIIRLAMIRKYGSVNLKDLDDSTEQFAHDVAMRRPR